MSNPSDEALTLFMLPILIGVFIFSMYKAFNGFSSKKEEEKKER